jgi:hypothetical protein
MPHGTAYEGKLYVGRFKTKQSKAPIPVPELVRPVIVIFRELREVDSVTIELRNQVEAICENSHHAQAKQIDLDDVHVCTILFIPLDERATWHGRPFQRHDLIELPLADQHAPAMLPKMTRKSLDAHGYLHAATCASSAAAHSQCLSHSKRKWNHERIGGVPRTLFLAE